eukprot:11207436-Lingulodinium_polyedra.AAC.1
MEPLARHPRFYERGAYALGALATVVAALGLAAETGQQRFVAVCGGLACVIALLRAFGPRVLCAVADAAAP